MDPIADTLIQIKNAGAVGKETVMVPHSKFRYAVLQALLKEGYIGSLEKKTRKQRKIIEVGLLYEEGKPRIGSVKRISKPSRRLYTGARNVWRVRQGFGDLFLSTPGGILTQKEARKQRIGGEVLFEIW
ncbi:MAG: 30S ribosomal protein S8 [Candidatus Lloydbacteria bacterium RIFCSPHIGHO2_02_FULL_51_22]|uniref:Small ribosomal subunit protein uS8 n=3 Tax=Candidatus Lloydiibacteriota TaxID=1817910 RepID=A0A1G2DDF7_9BACT|nr:MAG: 30S ribosomal protein S8 [Candidatus Lloydbacteria bacterium RIFCSPHIGHO2_02_FULL_51_22]OGZ15785.1 MAG: 30S ribosomal protein S8 [Candidatus Lloydbacteria bacterium RIFCSPLOWO2_02_FULL_51_11]OGZ16972.1 MAG: 30S ribosomal protein S8 [Candidatus Lloydbacteria bacterium RIFCSPLOWO2_12_FULL_51_9]